MVVMVQTPVLIEDRNGTCKNLNSSVILVAGCLMDNQVVVDGFKRSTQQINSLSRTVPVGTKGIDVTFGWNVDWNNLVRRLG